AARIASTAASPRPGSRPLTRTCAPRRASRTAVARPMPLVAPVIRAVLPARSVEVMGVPFAVIWVVRSTMARQNWVVQSSFWYAPGMSDHETGAPAGRPLTRRGRETRQRIVAAASELMFDNGVAETTLEDIRAAAGVSGS